MKKGTKQTLDALSKKRAIEAGWLLPHRATPEQIAAAKKIQSQVRGWLTRQHRHGLAGKVEAAIEKAEIQLIKHPLLGCMCNLTTRWGCEWSNRNRKPLLVMAGMLILGAFTIQKFAFLGLWLDPQMLSYFPWAEYEVHPEMILALIFAETNRSDWNAMVQANATAALLRQNNSLIPMKGNIWGQCGWLSGSADWGFDDGSSRCWRLDTL